MKMRSKLLLPFVFLPTGIAAWINVLSARMPWQRRTATPSDRATSHQQRRCHQCKFSHCQTSTKLHDASLPMMETSPLAVAGVALGLGIAAQSFINQMLEGDQGLGAFLRDGAGFNKSGFRDMRGAMEKSDDPLPWLKLPQLDFVEVSGQPDRKQEQILLGRLEALRIEMNVQLEQGNVNKATQVRNELETLMRDSGIEYQVD